MVHTFCELSRVRCCWVVSTWRHISPVIFHRSPEKWMRLLATQCTHTWMTMMVHMNDDVHCHTTDTTHKSTDYICFSELNKFPFRYPRDHSFDGLWLSGSVTLHNLAPSFVLGSGISRILAVASLRNWAQTREDNWGEPAISKWSIKESWETMPLRQKRL